MEGDWPTLDFNKFPNNMISGLTTHEINEAMNQQYTFNELDEYLHVSPKTSQFSNATDKQIEDASNNLIPKGTKARNKWAVGLYMKWEAQRFSMSGDDQTIPIPKASELKHASLQQLDYWLAKFIFEVVNSNGGRYPRDSLISIVAGINSHLKEERSIDLFKQDDFRHFRSILDAACIESSRQGIGICKKQAEVITATEEELLWTKKALGGHTSRALIDTLVFYNGLHFALRSGKEHRDLNIDQIKVKEPNENTEFYVLEYHENVSKTNFGGLKHRRVEPKIVRHVDTMSIRNPERSHALLLKKYLELRPSNSPPAFYLTPITSSSNDQGRWFKTTPIGHNTLSTTVKRLCNLVGIEGFKSNHSLRATCATRLFNEGVDEQIIMSRTGHRTTTGVRSYKRMGEIHHYNSSVVIDNQAIQRLQNQESATNNFTFNFHQGCNVIINNTNKNNQ